MITSIPVARVQEREKDFQKLLAKKNERLSRLAYELERVTIKDEGLHIRLSNREKTIKRLQTENCELRRQLNLHSK
tara:strand:+ start:561 stop:788 length:228 start_codon:yes stop_codon:yes gene_type:complete